LIEADTAVAWTLRRTMADRCIHQCSQIPTPSASYSPPSWLDVKGHANTQPTRHWPRSWRTEMPMTRIGPCRRRPPVRSRAHDGCCGWCTPFRVVSCRVVSGRPRECQTHPRPATVTLARVPASYGRELASDSPRLYACRAVIRRGGRGFATPWVLLCWPRG